MAHRDDGTEAWMSWHLKMHVFWLCRCVTVVYCRVMFSILNVQFEAEFKVTRNNRNVSNFIAGQHSPTPRKKWMYECGLIYVEYLTKDLSHCWSINFEEIYPLFSPVLCSLFLAVEWSYTVERTAVFLKTHLNPSFIFIKAVTNCFCNE